MVNKEVIVFVGVVNFLRILMILGIGLKEYFKLLGVLYNRIIDINWKKLYYKK